MAKSKFSVFLSLLLVFFSGAVLGAFSYRLYMVRTVIATLPPAKRPRLTPEEFLKQRLDEMRDKVKVDDQQLEQVRQVYQETREKYDEVHHEMNVKGKAIDESQVAKIKAILRPDQIPAYDQLRAEHEAARQRAIQQRQQGGEHK